MRTYFTKKITLPLLKAMIIEEIRPTSVRSKLNNGEEEKFRVSLDGEEEIDMLTKFQSNKARSMRKEQRRN